MILTLNNVLVNLKTLQLSAKLIEVLNSYVTVTGKIQMVDMECIHQALEKLGAANMNASNNLTFTINNRHYNYSIARNGVLTTRSHFVNEVNFIGKIEQNYQQVLAEKQERIRQEKIRRENCVEKEALKRN